MRKLKDLLMDGTISKQDVRSVARQLLEPPQSFRQIAGFRVQAAAFDALDERAQGYLVKIVLEFPVSTVLDLAPPPDSLEQTGETE